MDMLASLLVAHFVGDYLLQNDYLANGKTRRKRTFIELPKESDCYLDHPIDPESKLRGHWYEPTASEQAKAALICLVHCAIYTAACGALTLGKLSPWMLLLCFVTHFLIDHFRLAVPYMDLAGQKGFKQGLGPWSIFIVDNSWHLLTSWAMVLIQAQLGLKGLL